SSELETEPEAPGKGPGIRLRIWRSATSQGSPDWSLEGTLGRLRLHCLRQSHYRFTGRKTPMSLIHSCTSASFRRASSATLSTGLPVSPRYSSACTMMLPSFISSGSSGFSGSGIKLCWRLSYLALAAFPSRRALFRTYPIGAPGGGLLPDLRSYLPERSGGQPALAFSLQRFPLFSKRNLVSQWQYSTPGGFTTGASNFSVQVPLTRCFPSLLSG